MSRRPTSAICTSVELAWAEVRLARKQVDKLREGGRWIGRSVRAELERAEQRAEDMRKGLRQRLVADLVGSVPDSVDVACKTAHAGAVEFSARSESMQTAVSVLRRDDETLWQLVQRASAVFAEAVCAAEGWAPTATRTLSVSL